MKTTQRKRHYSQKRQSNDGCIIRCPTQSHMIRHAILTTSFFVLPQCKSFAHQSASTPPTGELLVQSQLAHYKNSNLAEVYESCSPWFQDVTGGLDDFEEAIHAPPYNLLLGHERADIMLETLPDTPHKHEGRISAACYLVCIKPGRHAVTRYPVWFWWEVSKHYLDVDEDGKLLNDDGEWKVDCVMPDFDDLNFEAESLVDYLDDDDDDDEGGDLDGPSFFMDFDDLI
eukprot:scaffold966_cov47-Cyclotella_meneghiniana.AAC.4